MVGLTFSAWRSEEHISILEVLLARGPCALDRSWTIHAEFAPLLGDSIRLVERSDSGAEVESTDLLVLLADDVQIMDGDLRSTSPNEGDAPIEIRSIRGHTWDVLSLDPDVLNQIARSFAEAQPLAS